MKISGSLCTVILALLIYSCRQNEVHDNIEIVNSNSKMSKSIDSLYHQVSIISLIANPERFDNRRVCIDGYLHVEFEGNVIYNNESDLKYGIEKNGLSLNIDRRAMNSIDAKGFQNHYVSIKGIFKKENLGHESVNSGGLDSVTVIDSLIKKN
jgi:hypothetical protein